MNQFWVTHHYARGGRGTHGMGHCHVRPSVNIIYIWSRPPAGYPPPPPMVWSR